MNKKRLDQPILIRKESNKQAVRETDRSAEERGTEDGRALYIFSSHPKGGPARRSESGGKGGGRVKRWGLL